jgi:type IV pilus assembly protein PilV
MMAMAVLSIGATGVIAMQKATLIGNVRARDLSIASAIASAWVERLRADAQRWSLEPTGLSTIESTTYLNVVGTDFPGVAGLEGVWFVPADDVANDMSAQADVRGHDTFNAADAGFCTHLRLTQITPNTIRAEVRVFWLRARGAGTVGGQPLCSTDSGYIASVDTAVDSYHFVYLSTAILRTDLDGSDILIAPPATNL